MLINLAMSGYDDYDNYDYDDDSSSWSSYGSTWCQDDQNNNMFVDIDNTYPDYGYNNGYTL